MEGRHAHLILTVRCDANQANKTSARYGTNPRPSSVKLGAVGRLYLSAVTQLLGLPMETMTPCPRHATVEVPSSHEVLIFCTKALRFKCRPFCVPFPSTLHRTDSRHGIERRRIFMKKAGDASWRFDAVHSVDVRFFFESNSAFAWHGVSGGKLARAFRWQPGAHFLQIQSLSQLGPEIASA